MPTLRISAKQPGDYAVEYYRVPGPKLVMGSQSPKPVTVIAVLEGGEYPIVGWVESDLGPRAHQWGRQGRRMSKSGAPMPDENGKDIFDDLFLAEEVPTPEEALRHLQARLGEVDPLLSHINGIGPTKKDIESIRKCLQEALDFSRKALPES